jgi:hypothetical protein
MPDLGRNVVVPIKVTGSQVAAQVFHCRDSASILIAGESGLTRDEIKARVAARVHCQFNIESLKARSLTRTGIRPTGYGLTLELLHTKATTLAGGPGNQMEREGDYLWTCMEGADFWGSSVTPCVYPEMHAHIRFSDHKLVHSNNGNAIRPTFASAFPSLGVANRFKGSMTTGLLKYLIISNNTTNPNVPYAPSLFRFSFPNGAPVSNIQDDLESPGGILKIEYGIADTVPSTPINLQVDFSLNAVTPIQGAGDQFRPKSLSYRDVNTSVPVTEGTRTPPQRGILITVRAYKKKGSTVIRVDVI